MARPKPIIVSSQPLQSEQSSTSANIDLGPIFDFFKKKKEEANLLETFKEATGTKETLGGLQLPSEELFPTQAPQPPTQFNLEALGGLSQPQPELQQPQAGLDLNALTRAMSGSQEASEAPSQFGLTDLLPIRTPQVNIPEQEVNIPPSDQSIAGFRGLLGTGASGEAQAAKGFGGIAFPGPEKKPDIFAKADITDHTRESIAIAEKSGLVSDLVMRPEVLEKKFSSGGQSPFQKTTILRKEHENASQNFLLKRGFFNDLMVSLDKPSGAGDVSMVYSYMKMLDPTSTVREGEAASAKDTAGLPASVRNTYNKIVDGEFLTPEQRMEFVDKAQDFYLNEKEVQAGNTKTYTDIAKRNKLSVADAVKSFPSRKTELNLLKIEQLQLEKLAKEGS